MKYNNVKKTIIHLLSIIMAISAVVASSLLVSAQSAATIENNYARLMQLQANAVAANECLNESFGHDAIFNMNAEGPVTNLVVKDRLLAHNPLGAIYSRYWKRKLGIMDDGEV